MQRINFCLFVFLLAAMATYGATHSAWSAPLALDSGVGIEGTSLNSPAAAPEISVLPNPASASHAICFQIRGKLDARAELKITEVNGKLVQSLPLGGLRSGGALNWSPVGKNGKPLASGVYLARLISGTASTEQKFILLK
jgi:hypothetical protein